jgi:hypothetical protein
MRTRLLWVEENHQRGPASGRYPMSGLALEPFLNSVRGSDAQGTSVRSGRWKQEVPIHGVRDWGLVLMDSSVDPMFSG